MASSKIVLTSSSDWRPWLFIIKSLALGGNVWKYIDPDLASPLPEPTLPTSPEAIEASPVARHTTLATLTPDERDVFKLLYNEYKEKLSQVKAEIESLKLIRTHLVTSVSKENVVYIESKEGIHDMLVALKKRLAPTDEARKLEIIGKYNRLRTFDKRTDVETWCKEWETTYADAVALNLSEVSGNRSQSDFAMALSSIDQAYSTAQQFWLQQSLKSDSTTKVPSLYDIIEDFRNNYRSNQALKINSRVGAFSVLTDEKKEYQESKDSNAELKLLKPCLCGTQHKYKNCLYITPSERPQGWKGEREVFERINKKISSLKNRSGKPLKSWFLSTFKYDGFDDPPTYGKENNSKINTSPKSLGAFTTYSSFKTASSDDYKLYHSWTLDSASDVHICNDPTISDWVTTKEACAGDEIFAGKTSYAIEAFGTVTIEVITDEGIALMQLQDVALAPGFMTNLVSLDRLNSKGVHWNSEYPTVLKRDQKPFCKLRRVGRHWTLQKDVRQKNIFNSFSTNSSHVPRTVKFTAKELHSVLAHASTQAINHVDSSDISIDYSVPCPTSSECETCSLAKAKKQISRRKEVEFESNGLPFFRIGWDMIEFEQAFNGDNYGSHIRCRDSGFEFSGTHPTKPGALAFFKKTVIFIQNTLRFKIHFCRLDGETTFGIEFEEFVAEQGIVAERTAPYSAEQNGGVERSGGIIVVKTRSFIIGANLPSRLWNEAFNAATYIKNRTPHHQLDWKTPFEVIFKNKPTYAHMHPYGCRAYALEHKIPRRQKMQPRAHIGYLVGYDSRNIYRIWIPSKKRVVRTRDVTFDHKSFWSADDLDIGDVLNTMSNNSQKKTT